LLSIGLTILAAILGVPAIFIRSKNYWSAVALEIFKTFLRETLAIAPNPYGHARQNLGGLLASVHHLMGVFAVTILALGVRFSGQKNPV
jgi:hypothetical protein